MKKLVALRVNYEDEYVEPKILSALRKGLPLEFIHILEASEPLPADIPTLQWCSYETLDFTHALVHHSEEAPQLINSYVIRKALIRKHYLAHTVLSHVTKHPQSILKSAFPTTVDFELDYAEFLDEALIEAYELQESFSRNERLPLTEREWWILKPSMSDRGQGIRLFSSEEELRGVFEAWEADEVSSDEDENVSDSKVVQNEGIITSHLRHFVAQRYVSPPLLIPEAPYSLRKFHIRTYAVAAGALKAYVYDQMLALFASQPYAPPSGSISGADQDENDGTDMARNTTRLEHMRTVHLTNTCVQNSSRNQDTEEKNVFLLSQLPLQSNQRASIKAQICEIVAELFNAALAHPTNFQAIPQSFEIYGIDFLVSTDVGHSDNRSIKVHLLEVNAFPDFAQTGEELRDIVVGGLFERITKDILLPMFPFTEGASDPESRQANGSLELQTDSVELALTVDDPHKIGKLIKVFETDIGRR